MSVAIVFGWIGARMDVCRSFGECHRCYARMLAWQPGLPLEHTAIRPSARRTRSIFCSPSHLRAEAPSYEQSWG
eukprot:6239215-Amphidinium_carterae.1